MKLKHLFKLFGFTAFAFLLVVASCKKSDDDSGGGDNNDPPEEAFDFGTITMKQNGNSWSSTAENNNAVIINDQFIIQAGNDDAILSLSLSPFPGEGSYQLNEDPLYYALFTDMLTVTGYASHNEGTVTISDYNAVGHRLTGTFEFLGYAGSDSSQSVTITEGVFTNIPMMFFQDQDASIITFSVNGEPWVAENASTSTNAEAYQMQVVASESISNSDGILVFPYDLNPGTYSLTQDFTKQKFTYNSMGSESGSLTITVNDKQNHHIEGVFDATVKNTFTNQTATISNGEFSFDY